MPRDKKRPRLGRGLSSLIGPSTLAAPAGEYTPSADPAAVAPAATPAPTDSGVSVRRIPRRSIRLNPHQPRKSFDKDRLRQLAGSIKTYGLLQPVLVRELPEPTGEYAYELIAGERRLRATELAGLDDLPCLLRPTSRQEMLELSLIENIHRTDLNPVERAAAYRDLMDRFSLTQQQVAERMDEPRASIANYLRLLDLCDAVQALVVDGRLTFGHAKVLAGLAGSQDAQTRLARKVVAGGLSVRKLEEMVERARGGPASKQGQSGQQRPPYIVDVERQLSNVVGTKVSIRPGRRQHSGKIVIDYYSLEDFDRIGQALGLRIDS